MAKARRYAISPLRAENFPEWYQQVVKAANLAENSPVRGCMVIKPWGYALWEQIQSKLDQMIKREGHVNAYFPLLIPLSFLEKEAKHVEGFAKECAVVTHHRLTAGPDGKLIPDGKLDEPLIIRPTSETIIGHSYSKWVQSYRDLPLLINQWANVMRWEMRTRMFLRTSEFLWQEGHTVHETQAEAEEETLKMLGVYKEFCEEFLAVPVVTGEKTPDEKFPGAVTTHTFEALLQDKKAIQGGTSHFLGQNFSKASEIKFLDREGKEQYGWTTSWGVTTRLIGTLIMSHGDDDGLIIPPKIAPIHIVICPIGRDEVQKQQVLEHCQGLAHDLRRITFAGSYLRVKVDNRDIRGGEKAWGYVKEGVPLRIEIGPKDLASNKVCMVQRNDPELAKQFIPEEEFKAGVVETLENMQKALFEKALEFRKNNTESVDSLEEFQDFFTNPERGGFALASWSEEAIGHPVLDKLKVTPRCIAKKEEQGTCIFTGKPSKQKVYFGKAY